MADLAAPIIQKLGNLVSLMAHTALWMGGDFHSVFFSVIHPCESILLTVEVMIITEAFHLVKSISWS